MILLQDGEPLQLGVCLGEGEDGGIARGNRLYLRVGKFLPADVLGAADGAFTGDDLRVLWSTTLQPLCGAIGYVSGRTFDR